MPGRQEPGWVIGWVFGWLTFAIPVSSRLASTRDGFIVLAATFISYSVTEMLHCYGFLAVFITALAFRHADRDHEFHVEMHSFIEQIERRAMMVVLVLFGGALVSGLLAPLRPVDVAAALIIVLVIRPLTGMLGFIGWLTRIVLIGYPIGWAAWLAGFLLSAWLVINSILGLLRLQANRSAKD